MDKRRAVINLAFTVDTKRAHVPAFLGTINRRMGNLIRELERVPGIFSVTGEVVLEGKPQGDSDAPEADNIMGDAN